MRVALNLEQCFQRPPGGIGRYASELARVLPDAGAPGEVAVVPFVARHSAQEIATAAQRQPVLADPVVLPYPRPVLYELWNRWGQADPLRSRRARARMQGVDLVHAPSVAVPPRGRVPLVVTVHDAATVLFPETYPRRGRRFHELGFLATAARADAIVAPTAAAADEIAEHTSITRDRIHPIHHGVDHALASDDEVRATRALHTLAGDPYVMWAGSMEPRKDVATLVDAFGRVAGAHALPHRLVLVGPAGWMAESDALARRTASLGDHVVFTGQVGPGELRALYRGAELFALPSRHEGFGMTVLEAMAQETAVLCSDLPVLREIAGDAATYAPAGDVDAWADALARLLGDDTERAARAAAGRTHSLNFTWERSAARHLAVYRSVQ